MPADTRPKSARLRIIATSDLHATVFPYDYYTDRPAPAIGLASAATLITDARAGAANCLLLDNGDTFQGTPLGEDAAKAAPSHPVIAAMMRLAMTR